LCRETIAAAVCERTAELVRPDALQGLTIGQAHREQISAAGIGVWLKEIGGTAT
jgi:hypothetical protein